MDIPYDLNGIQPRATWVWNCDEIGFDPNGRWNKAIFTYNFLPGERMRKVKTVERPPFWCTWLVSTWENRRCFIPPIILHQTKEYFEDLHFKIPLDWTVHHTPSGYMDRERWLKPMTQLYHVFCTLITAQLYIWTTKKSNPLSWKQATLSTTSPMITS